MLFKECVQVPFIIITEHSYKLVLIYECKYIQFSSQSSHSLESAFFSKMMVVAFCRSVGLLGSTIKSALTLQAHC